MIVAVVGSREFDNYPLLCQELDALEIKTIISGGARGADKLAERYANHKGIPTQILLPDWDKYGKPAGIIRNRDIVSSSDFVVAFWNGKSPGTKNSIGTARKMGKEVRVVHY